MIGFGLFPARVVGTYGASNAYHVVGPYFDDIAFYFGEGAGTLGARRSGGLAPGTQVVVGMVEGDNHLRIMAVDQSPTNPRAQSFVPRLLTGEEEQVSGYREGHLYRNMLDGDLHVGLHESRNDGFQDLVNGEWGMVSYFGAAVMVEHFRSALRAGHFAELAFYTQDQMGRLRALKWEHDTFLSEHKDTFDGNFAEKSSKCFYGVPDAASTTSQHRSLSYSGPGHLGSSSYTAPPAEEGVARAALSYDHLDQNGIRVIGAAGGLILERRVDLDVPQEKEVEERETLLEQYQAALDEPRSPLTFSGELSTVVHAQSAMDVIDSITGYRSRNATDTVTQRWEELRFEPVDNLVQGDGSMWGALPQVVEVNLDNGPQEFYVGRSMFALLPDGSVLVENADGVQIMASGPNLVLSAPGDIIEVCGGTKQVIAGRSIALRAHDNVDVAANSGRVSMKAETLFSILGGNNGGAEGVLIESRSSSVTSSTGIGGENQVGGLVLRSRGGLFAAADGDLGLYSASGMAVRIDDGGQLFLDAGVIAARIVDAIQVFANEDTAVLDLVVNGENSQLFVSGSLYASQDVIALRDGLYGGQLVTGGNIASAGSVGAAGGVGTIDNDDNAIQNIVSNVQRSLAQFDDRAAGNRRLSTQFFNRDIPMSEQQVKTYGFILLQTTDLNLPANFAYALPEMRWQQRSTTGTPWTENYVQALEADALTAPYPGFDIWSEQGKYLKGADGLYFDPVTARSTLSEPGADPGSEITVGQRLPLSEFVRQA